jgi:hypothetical protein
LLQAPWLDPAYFNLSNLTQFGQFGTNMGNLANLPCPPSWDHHHMRRVTDPLVLIKGIFTVPFEYYTVHLNIIFFCVFARKKPEKNAKI